MDEKDNARKLAEKVMGLRIFNDEAGKMNPRDPRFSGWARRLRVGDPRGEQLHRLRARRRGRRPAFTLSAPYGTARERFEEFASELRLLGVSTQIGEFGADMRVSLVNDGPGDARPRRLAA